MEADDPSSQGTANFRKYLPKLDSPRLLNMQKQNAREYAATFKTSQQPPWLHALFVHWRELFSEPYRGITSDGHILDDLYKVKDEEISIDPIVDATRAVLSEMTPEQAAKTTYHVESPEWRSWSNPEFLLSDKGVRLDEVSAELRRLVLRVLETTVSPEGYQKALDAMRINHFLGQLVNAPAIMNEFSYNFVLFGEPSTTHLWGFSFYGHHLCLNIALYRTQIIIAPWFTGAEPNVIDEGPNQGTRILQTEEILGLRLMQSLPAKAQIEAQIYKLMKDPEMPWGRWNHDDQRHLCGAYRDNRIVPYEGILVSSMGPDQQKLILNILNEFLLYLPLKSRQLRLAQIESWFHQTYWSWIGAFADEDPFYYRIQSPVILVEFDHHSGVFLNNEEPAKFHIHTLLRMPNRGDYGMALKSQIERREQAFTWCGS